MQAAEREWQAFASDDWTSIDFRQWPRGFHRSAWVVAGYVGWNPLDLLDHPPTPAARAVNALVTRHCLILTVAMTRDVPDPRHPTDPLLAWFNKTREEHQHGIAAAVEAMGDAEWDLPTSRKKAARKLVGMWNKDGSAAFGNWAAASPGKPHGNRGQDAHARGHRTADRQGGHEEGGMAGTEIGGPLVTAKQDRIAANIDAAMQPFRRRGADDITILTGMGDHMVGFKHLLDTAKPGTMHELCRRHPGFHRYAKVLEGIGGAIQSGAITVPR